MHSTTCLAPLSLLRSHAFALVGATPDATPPLQPTHSPTHSAQLDNSSWSACEWMRSLVSMGAYLPFVRDHVVQAQYFKVSLVWVGKGGGGEEGGNTVAGQYGGWAADGMTCC